MGGHAYLVLGLVDLAILRVDSSNQHVIGDVVEMAAIFQPRPSHADVVCCALTLHLDQDQCILQSMYNMFIEQLSCMQDAQDTERLGCLCLHRNAEAEAVGTCAYQPGSIFHGSHWHLPRALQRYMLRDINQLLGWAGLTTLAP